MCATNPWRASRSKWRALFRSPSEKLSQVFYPCTTCTSPGSGPGSRERNTFNGFFPAPLSTRTFGVILLTTNIIYFVHWLNAMSCGSWMLRAESALSNQNLFSTAVTTHWLNIRRTSCLPATPTLSFHLARSCSAPLRPACWLERTDHILPKTQRLLWRHRMNITQLSLALQLRMSSIMFSGFFQGPLSNKQTDLHKCTWIMTRFSWEPRQIPQQLAWYGKCSSAS